MPKHTPPTQLAVRIHPPMVNNNPRTRTSSAQQSPTKINRTPYINNNSQGASDHQTSTLEPTAIHFTAPQQYDVIGVQRGMYLSMMKDVFIFHKRPPNLRGNYRQRKPQIGVGATPKQSKSM